MVAPLLAVLVHGERQLDDPLEASVGPMRLELHQPNHLPPLEEVFVLPRDQRIPLEERDDHRLQLGASVHRVGHDATVGPFGCDTATAEEALQRLQDPDVVPMLIRLKAWCDQPPGPVPNRGMRVDAHGEASLAVHEAGHVVWSQRASRSSLLIVPTRRIVTAHVATVSPVSDIPGLVPRDTRDIPAY